MKDNFVKLNRSETTKDLIECHPNAFLLLTLIALRARRTPNMIRGLDICECQIGDYKACGLTEQKYRSAKKILSEFGLVNFQPTNKGTIARIVNTMVYDINANNCNDQTTSKITDKETDKQRSNNDQITTNKNVKKEKNEKNIKPPTPLREYLEKKIDEEGYHNIKEQIITFFEYRMSKPKKEQYNSERGINGLFRHLKSCREAGLDLFDCMEIAMENNWQTPNPDYFKNSTNQSNQQNSNWRNEWQRR